MNQIIVIIEKILDISYSFYFVYFLIHFQHFRIEGIFNVQGFLLNKGGFFFGVYSVDSTINFIFVYFGIKENFYIISG